MEDNVMRKPLSLNQLKNKILDMEKANHQLRILIEEYRLQFKNISDVVFMIDTDFNISNISPSVEKLLGYKAEDFIGRPASDLRQILTSESFDRAIANLSKMLKGEKIPATTYAFVAKDGTLKHIEIYGSPLIRYGQVAGTISVARDITERKKTENQLIQSEGKYRTLIENIHDGIYILDSFGKFTFVNDVIVKRSGFPSEWFLRRSYLDVISEKDREHVQKSFNEVMDGKTKIYDLSYPVKSGDLFHVEVCTAPLFDDAMVIGLLGISRDITERKQAEKALRESEQQLASIYNTVGDVIFHLAVEPAGQFRFVSVNPAFLKVTGLSPEMMVGRTVNEIIPEPSLTMVLGKYRQAIAENTIVRWEEVSDYPTGRLTGVVSIAPVFNDKGACTHLVGSVHDITERKQVEEVLKENEKKYRELSIIDDLTQLNNSRHF